jgi:hypothetical protein
MDISVPVDINAAIGTIILNLVVVEEGACICHHMGRAKALVYNMIRHGAFIL